MQAVCEHTLNILRTAPRAYERALLPCAGKGLHNTHSSTRALSTTLGSPYNDCTFNKRYPGDTSRRVVSISVPWGLRAGLVRFCVVSLS